MGRGIRRIPEKLPLKLRQVREAFATSQRGWIEILDIKGIGQSLIAGYELGLNDPTYDVLLRYAELANVCVSILIDDRLDLPEKLPAKKTVHHH